MLSNEDISKNNSILTNKIVTAIAATISQRRSRIRYWISPASAAANEIKPAKYKADLKIG